MKLYPYQTVGIEFLVHHKRAYLADGMGLGKSAQAIVAARKIGVRTITIVCPASAIDNWRNEWEKWNGPGEPEIISYSSLIRRKLKAPDLVILDEAHYAKSPSARRTRAALGLGAKAQRCWLLSGTPMPNNPTELWSCVKILWPDISDGFGIRTAVQWMNHFCLTRPTIYGPKPYAVRNGAQLREALQTFMLRRTLKDIDLQLPPLRIDLVRLPKNKAMGQALKDYAVEDAKEESMYATLRRHLGVAKAPAIVKQLVEELDNKAYKAIVVLYYHRQVGDILRGAFRTSGYEPVGFDGSMPRKARTAAIAAFQAGNARVFLAQQQSAGLAINLTAASEIVLVEPAWSPEDNRQAIARIHRIGQDAPCRARIFAVAGTMDEAIMNTLHQKVAMQREVL